MQDMQRSNYDLTKIRAVVNILNGIREFGRETCPCLAPSKTASLMHTPLTACDAEYRKGIIEWIDC